MYIQMLITIVHIFPIYPLNCNKYFHGLQDQHEAIILMQNCRTFDHCRHVNTFAVLKLMDMTMGCVGRTMRPPGNYISAPRCSPDHCALVIKKSEDYGNVIWIILLLKDQKEQKALVVKPLVYNRQTNEFSHLLLIFAKPNSSSITQILYRNRHICPYQLLYHQFKLLQPKSTCAFHEIMRTSLLLKFPVIL